MKEINGLKETVKDQGLTIDKYKKTVDSHEQTIDAHEEELMTLRSDREALNQRIVELVEERDKLKQEWTALKGEIQTINNWVTIKEVCIYLTSCYARARLMLIVP